MLFLLRQIRRKLLANNKVTTYLLYAIGEIFLVVIGISIAVSIDNWNDRRKEANLELEILKNLKQDVEFNMISIQSVSYNDSLVQTSNRLLLKHLQDPNSQYHDSLQSYFGNISRYDVFAPRRMAYEALKSKGLEIIRNESLRSSIIQLYDEAYQLNTLALELRKDIHINSIPVLNKRFITMEDVGMKIPNDFESLKTDSEFINSLSYIAAEGLNFLRHHENHRQKTAALGQQIEEEIKKIEAVITVST